MGYRYPPGAVRRLDDALLAVFGERYVALHGNATGEALLRDPAGPADLSPGCVAPRAGLNTTRIWCAWGRYHRGAPFSSRREVPRAAHRPDGVAGARPRRLQR